MNAACLSVSLLRWLEARGSKETSSSDRKNKHRPCPSSVEHRPLGLDRCRQDWPSRWRLVPARSTSLRIEGCLPRACCFPRNQFSPLLKHADCSPDPTLRYSKVRLELLSGSVRQMIGT